MTQNNFLGSETTKRYDIPLSHLDYSYVKTCNDVKELEKILRVLRNGEEGCYPELEHATEQRLEKLNPKSRLLRKDAPVLTRRDLDKSELENLDHDLQNWSQDMASREESLVSGSDSKTAREDEPLLGDDGDLPPVRTGTVITADGKVFDKIWLGKKHDPENDKTSKSSKRVKPRSYQEWDKFDADKEVEKVDQEPEKNKSKPVKATFKADSVAHNIDTKGMTEEEKRVKAVREKDKGNEAFHSRDFEESIVYYTRSISIAPLAATYNNRALAYLRLSKWDEAVKDCNYVLKMEPQNLKALLRRGTALKGKGDMTRAGQDMRKVLEVEPNNKTALDLMKEINAEEKKKAEQVKARKEKGRRMIIEEVDGSDDEENNVEEIEVETPDAGDNRTPALNGYTEKAESREDHTPLLNGHTGQVAADEESIAANTSDASQASRASEELQASQTSEEVQASDVTETSQAAGKEENEVDVPSSNKGTSAVDAEKDEDSSNSDTTRSQETLEKLEKQKLVATNILHETTGVQEEGVESAQSAADRVKAVSDEAAVSAGAGDADSLVHVSTTDVGKAADVQQREEQSSEDDSAESETDAQEAVEQPSHARPVFIQRALPSKVADLRETGNNLFRSGQYSEAIRVYSDIISKLETETGQEVNLSLMYSNRSACHLKTGDCQSAISDCTTSLSFVPHSAKPLLRRATAYETLERYHHAYVDYKHVLALDSSAVQAHQGASRCQHTLHNQHGHRWRQKLPPLTRVSQWDIPEIINEADAASRAETSIADRTENSRHSEAKRDGQEEKSNASENEKAATEIERPKPEKAVSKEDQFEEVKSRGNKHVQKGEYEEAAQCYCQCLEIFSDRVAVFTNRALCYIKLNKGPEAEADCSKALSLEPNNTKAYYRRALARKMCGQYKESLQDLLQLLRLEPTNTAAKREMELVKGLYKKEFDQLKQQPTMSKPATKPEKKRKRMKIEEVEDESGSEDQDSKTEKTATVKPKAPGASEKPPGAGDKPQVTKTPEGRKHGRGKGKKGGAKETSVGLPVTPSTLPAKPQGKITPYEFIQHWNALKQAKDIQPYVHLLEQVSPDDLPSVISNKLDGHMLQIITRCAAHDAQTGEVERAYNILCKLRQVPRFTTVVMFLSSKEKQDIRKVLESVASLGAHSAEDVAAVRKDYGVK
ncbi:hypothetical protein BaRGS_00032315 [Batillaria attramentaria]|uniref:RNA-polymerase II-associated protein 3-like C-terminal domain-containing protein n=1 Tax=Batillaria attramentaria TaxID=370345 RepID=A0ABD0JN89_9CAEN